MVSCFQSHIIPRWEEGQAMVQKPWQLQIGDPKASQGAYATEAEVLEAALEL